MQGSSFTVTYGKIGTEGQTQTKSFASAEKAQAEADKLVREKTSKGYVETTPTAAISRSDGFEKAIVANPHDGTLWRAYADYLCEQGDPRGELMQLQLALENEGLKKSERDELKAKEKALLNSHKATWLGELIDDKDLKPGEVIENKNIKITIVGGWIRRVQFKQLTVNLARALGKTASARLLRELVVETIESEAPIGSDEKYIDSYYEPGPDVPLDISAYSGPGLQALCRCPHLGSVTLFQLGEGEVGLGAKHEEYPNCHTSGELAYHLVKQMPQLEELYLLSHRVDANKIFALPLPHLRILQLYHSNRYPLDKLAANKSLTNLTTILCHPHAIDYYSDEEEPGAYIRLAHLRAICRSPHLTSLLHLRLRLSDFGDKGADEIVDSGLLKRLKMLDLQGGCISDAGAKRLADCPDLKNLEFLNLRANALTKTGIEALNKTGVKLDVSAQHDTVGGDWGDGELPEYLFEGDIE